MFFQRFVKYSLLFIIVISGSHSLYSQAVKVEYVEAELVSEFNSIQPGKTLPMALRLKMDDEWHTYWRNPGDAGLPTELEWDLPEGFEATGFNWPAPERVVTPPLVSYGYSHEILLPFELKTPENLQDGSEVTLKATASWLVCREVCLPGEADLHITLPVRNDIPQPNEKWATAFAETRDKLPIKNSNWLIEAAVQDTLLIIQATSQNAQAGALSTFEFCPYEEGIIDNAVLPEYTKLANGGRLAFRISNWIEEPIDSIAGVLLSENGWRGPGSEKALAIQIPTQDKLTATETASRLNQLLIALGFSLIGGLILNLMPCVLPVLSIKVLSFVKQANETDSKPWKHGAVFTIGVLASFWVLAGALIILRASGEQLGWGFQLQSPAFIVVLSTIIFLFGLSLFGVFEIGTSLIGTGSKLDQGSGIGGSFWSGVAATVVATPCTAPFMGSALGFALTRPVWEAMLVFTFLGLGMALPYLLLASIPALLKFVPKPGRWMESFKQFMGFLMMATVVWLVWVLGNQTGVDGIAILLFALLSTSIAAWLYGRWATPVYERRTRMTATIVAAVIILAGVVFGITNTQSLSPGLQAASRSTAQEWEPYSAAKLQAYRDAGTPVFIDFTAAWCLSCKVNERVAFGSGAVHEKFAELGVVPMKADWTNRDPEITKGLAQFGRNSVPLYVLYDGKGSPPKILPEIITETIVMEALTTITSNQSKK